MEQRPLPWIWIGAAAALLLYVGVSASLAPPPIEVIPNWAIDEDATLGSG